MLLKWIFLFLITWYIYRAAGNLISAARGRQQVPDSRRPETRRPASDGPDISIVRPRQEARASRPDPDDVEDARFQDL